MLTLAWQQLLWSPDGFIYVANKLLNDATPIIYTTASLHTSADRVKSGSSQLLACHVHIFCNNEWTYTSSILRHYSYYDKAITHSLELYACICDNIIANIWELGLTVHSLAL